MKKLNLNENFISRIWEESSYYKDLKTTDGLGVEVLDYGVRNPGTKADYNDIAHLPPWRVKEKYR